MSEWGSLFSSTDERWGHRELKRLVRRQTARQYGKIGLLAPESAPFTTRLPLNEKLFRTRKASRGDLVQCQQVGEGKKKKQKTKEISLKPRTSSNTSLFSSLLQDASLLTRQWRDAVR